MQVTVVLRPRQALPSIEQLSGQRPALSREEVEAAHAADPADVAKVENFARQNGLDIVESSPERRSVILSGSREQIQAVFGTDPNQIPAGLQDVAAAVLGISDRPVARPL